LNSIICPLCSSKETKEFSRANNKLYHKCSTCNLIFIDASYLPSLEEERLRYETHNNDPNDERYITHLKKLTDPLLTHLKKGMIGLDYGCGAGRAVSLILEKEGLSVKNFDPFFYDEKSLLNEKYDFITCTETAEHFHNPAKEFEGFINMLMPGGILAIMTNFYSDDINFDKWWYPRDPTHVVFYSRHTFEWICTNYDLFEMLFDNDVIFFLRTVPR
jgi:SAM-dependent methyltransferase